MRKALKILIKTVEWIFIVFCVYIGSFFFREARIPSPIVDAVISANSPTNIFVHVDSVHFGFMHGLTIRGLKIYEQEKISLLSPMMAAETISIYPFQRQVTINGAYYPRLPDSYYAPENNEKNARVEAVLPEISKFSLTLVRPNILDVRPERVICDISVTTNRFTADNIHLDWNDSEERMFLDGFCYVDLGRQEIYGEVNGSAKQYQIRPLIVALDVPVALPYMDGFTEVPGKVPSWCAWKVNLVNNDFDLFLNLHPMMGKYNLVPMKKVDGKIHLHVYTRGTWLNYRQTIGPIVAKGPNNEPLEGTIIVEGTNGYNTVTVKAESTLPVADLLKIGGFTGEYVGEDVTGEAKGEMVFKFPRAMTNNYEVLNGGGHLECKNGQIMRLQGFKGLLSLLADKVPGVSWFTDSTQASCDYTIENGILKSNNIYIEGTVFSIKMYGQFDTIKDELDFTVRVQFAKSDSIVGKVLQPITWPFTKLLLEFKLTGAAENPKWEYISVIDRVVEVAQ